MSNIKSLGESPSKHHIPGHLGHPQGVCCLGRSPSVQPQMVDGRAQLWIDFIEAGEWVVGFPILPSLTAIRHHPLYGHAHEKSADHWGGCTRLLWALSGTLSSVSTPSFPPTSGNALEACRLPILLYPPTQHSQASRSLLWIKMLVLFWGVWGVISYTQDTCI